MPDKYHWIRRMGFGELKGLERNLSRKVISTHKHLKNLNEQIDLTKELIKEYKRINGYKERNMKNPKVNKY